MELAVIRHVEEPPGRRHALQRFGIRRQARCIWYRRFKVEGVEGLLTRPTTPKTSPNATHVEAVGKIIYLRQNYHFGPRRS
ncbi:leucine zipper domain-containing protein [Streptomyces sp. NPDC050418]|uniref:leucine zipper domain-containing protein n=1 Tax=Streptomyces sp. NPDC050418 TaxID=3365612 RepID=UPI00379E8294